MGKLKKLKLLNKIKRVFLYEFKIPKTLFKEINVKVYFVSKLDNYIICYGNNKAYKVLSCYEDVLIKKQFNLILNKYLVKRLIMVITLLIVIAIFFSSSLFIREIKFKDNNLYDQRIYNYVYNTLDKKLWFYTLKEDITTINNNLRASFPNYAYLGVSRNSSTLIIDVELINIRKEEQKFEKLPCDIISKKDAVITGISCKSGKVLVNLNQYVKQGELLVTGKLSENIDVYSDAVICGMYVDYIKINVNKIKNSYGLTGKIKGKLNIKVGNNYLFNFEDYYQNQRFEVNNIVNVFNLINLVNVNYYEEGDIVISYDYNSALNYATSMLYYDLEVHRTSPLEKILEIKLLDSTENSEEFLFKFAVKQIKNIGIRTKISEN